MNRAHANAREDSTELERVQEPIRKILLKADPFGEIDQTGTFNELMEFVTTYAQTVAEEAVRDERERKGWKGYAVVDAETDYYLYSDFFVNKKDAVKYWKNEMSETKDLVIIELDVYPTLTPLPDKE